MLMSTTLLSMILSIAVNEDVNVLFYMILLPKFSLFLMLLSISLSMLVLMFLSLVLLPMLLSTTLLSLLSLRLLSLLNAFRV